MRLRELEGLWKVSPWKLAVAAMVVGAAVAGVVILADETNQWWILAVVAAFAVVATFPAIGRRVLQLLCAAVVGLFVLLTVAALVRGAKNLLGIEGRAPIWVGLLFAVLVFGAAAFWYLHGNWPHARPRGERQADTPRRFEIPSPEWRVPLALLAAALLAGLVILVLPILVFAIRDQDKDEVATPRPVVSQIEALIVSAEPREVPPGILPRGEAPAPYADSSGFDVTYSVAFADGDGVRWTRTGMKELDEAVAALEDFDAPAQPPPAPVDDADRVLLLVVDGTPPEAGDPATLPNVAAVSGEVARWRRIARAAAPSGTHSYPLLQTTSRARLHDWERFIRRGTHVRNGEALSVQKFARPSVPDAAVQLAISSPGAQEDFTLALRHQPIVLFDSAEPVPRPLSVEYLFRLGKVKQCSSRRLGGEDCPVVRDPRALENGGTHLQLALPRRTTLRRLARLDEQRLAEAASTEGTPEESPALAPPPAAPPGAAPVTQELPTAIYVHPVPTESEQARTLYLDYWWYLPDNPAGSGGGAFCGPGLVIPGISCFDHQSDWEGVTVVIDRTRPGRTPEPQAVHYAQHGDVVSYSWDELRAAWGRTPSARRLLADTPGGDARPLVYVARGTHAAYPLPCPSARRCRQVAHDIKENRHNGGLPWVGNSAPCGEEACLKLLPTAVGGRAPALWNAFEGVWGERHCFLTYYCDSTSPPAAPGQQDRYKRPGQRDGEYLPAAAPGED